MRRLPRLLAAVVAVATTVFLLAGPAAAHPGHPEVSNERPIRIVWMIVGVAVFVTVITMIQVFEVNKRKRAGRRTN